MNKGKNLRCQHCGHTWEYGGENPYYATCPRCRALVSIRKHTIDVKEKNQVKVKA